MAKNKKSRRRPAQQSTAVATPGEELDDARPGVGGGPDSDIAARGPLTTNGHDDVPRGRGAASGGLGVYKPGQGYYTRLSTAVGSGVIAAFGAHYLYSTISADNPAWQLGVPTAFLAVCGALIFWVVGSSRRTNDFFIATEGEMKKVSWSSRREVIGSTKVVMLFTLLMAFLLFFVDILFLTFFSWIGVLEINLLDAIGWKANG